MILSNGKNTGKKRDFSTGKILQLKNRDFCGRNSLGTQDPDRMYRMGGGLTICD